MKTARIYRTSSRAPKILHPMPSVPTIGKILVRDYGTASRTERFKVTYNNNKKEIKRLSFNAKLKNRNGHGIDHRLIPTVIYAVPW
jgi:hypothetical protein